MPPTIVTMTRSDPTHRDVEWGGGGSGWIGWIVFAGVVMVLSGMFDIVWGIAAIARDEVFLIDSQDNVISVSYTTAGWVSLVLGTFVLIAGLSLFAGAEWAAVVALGLAGLSAVGNLLAIGAYPLWSVMVIAMNVLVIYAITVHGEEMRQ